MKSLTKVLFIFVLVLLVGFTLVANENTAINVSQPRNEVVPVNEANNSVNKSVLNYTDKGTMIASWYGPKFHGKLTANGETYDQMAFTAAHKQLKFGNLGQTRKCQDIFDNDN